MKFKTAAHVCLVTCYWALCTTLQAQTKIQVEIKDHRTSETPISKLIFGNFIEAGFGRQVDGIWSEMIYNRAFMLPGSYPGFGDVKSTVQWWMFPASMYNSNAPFWHSGYEEPAWEITDTAALQLSRTHGTESFKGLSSLLITKSSETSAGLSQKGIYLQTGRKYHFSITGGFRQGGYKISKSLPGFASVAGENETKPFEVLFRDEKNPNRILFRTIFNFRGSQQRFDWDFANDQFTGRAIIELSYTWKGNVALSSVSLMPADNIFGWRKDVVQLLKDIKVPVIRYPGGCYASFYDWRKYVGPRDERETSSSFYWGGLDDNDASIDEFLQLCDAVGCEPQICVNMMSSTPFKAAEFVEYLNGSDASSMGRFRLENGVSRKGKVRLFEMDNEAGRKWTALEYAYKVVDFAKAMKAVDPDIKLMMMTYSFDHEQEYLPQMLQVAGKYVDFIINRNGSPAFVNRTLQMLKKYNAANGTDIKLTNSEWLADGNSPEPFADKDVPQQFRWSPRLESSYKKVLSYRQIHWFYALNGAARLLDYLSYGGDYYLANFNNCVNTWGQNVIESSKEGSWLSPMGKVFQFFAAQEERYPLQSQLNSNQKAEAASDGKEALNDSDADFPLIVNRKSQTELFKVQACETGGGINVYFVNKSTSLVDLQEVLPKGYYAISIDDLYAPDRLSRSYLDHSDIKTSTRTIKRSDNISIRPLSLNRIRIVKGKN